MRTGKLRSFFIIWLPLALIVLSSFIYLMRVFKESVAFIPSLVSSFITDNINGSVNIGSIDLFYTKGIIIKNTEITGNDDGDTKINIPKITIKADLKQMIAGKSDIKSAIELIDIENPYISITRRIDGGWSISDLLKPSAKPKEIDFPVPIQVRSAIFKINDYKSHPSKNLEVNILSNVNAVINIPDKRNVKFTVAGRGNKTRLNTIKATGEYNIIKKTYTVDVKAEDIATKYWSAYPYDSHLNVVGGTADASVILKKNEKDKPIEYLVKADVDDTLLKFDEIKSPIQRIKGKIELSRDIVIFDVKAAFGSSPFDIAGYVTDFSDPVLAIDIGSNNLDIRKVIENTVYSRFIKDMKSSPNAKLNAKLVGTIKSPGIDFRLIAPQFDYHGYKFNSADISGVYENRKISLSQVIANFYGGNIVLNGGIDLAAKKGIGLTGSISSVNVSKLPALKSIDINAIANGGFRVIWMPKDLKVDYDLALDHTRFRDFQFDEALLNGRYYNGVTYIDIVKTGIFDGSLMASGIVSQDKKLDLSVCGTDIDLSFLNKKDQKEQFAGKGQFAGKITGGYKSPKFDGIVEGYDVSGSGFDLERISGMIVADRKSVKIDDLTIYTYPGDIAISGVIKNPLDKQPLLNVNASINSLDIEKFLKNHQIKGLSKGILSSNMQITGVPRRLAITGDLKITDALYSDIPIDSLNVSASYKNQNIEASSIDLVSGIARFSASGKLNKDKSINGIIKGTGVPLNQFTGHLLPYLSVNGLVDIDGTVSGSMSYPFAELNLTGKEPIINNKKFTSLNAGISINKESALLQSIELVDNNSVYAVKDAYYSFTDKLLKGSAEFKNAKGDMLLSLVDFSPYFRQISKDNLKARTILRKFPRPFDAEINALLSGTIDLNTGIAVPDLELNANIRDMQYGSGKLNLIDMQGSWKDNVISLNKFDASEGDTNISADAILGPNDVISANIDIHNFKTSLIEKFVKLPDNFSGDIDVTIIANGSRYNPTVQASLEVVDPIIAGSKFDRIRAGFSSVGIDAGSSNPKNINSVGTIDVDEITLVLNDHNFRTSGYIPVDWRGFTIRRDSPILLESVIDQDALNIVSSLTGFDFGIKNDGKFEGVARIANTIAEPNFSGVLSLKNGYFNIPKISQTFDIDQADFSLSGNKVMIDSLKGQSAGGGVFSAEGNISFGALKPILDTAISFNSLMISAKNLSNVYGENIDIELTGNTKITGPVFAPKISGIISANNGQVFLSGKAVPQQQPKVTKFNPDFDINAALNDDLQFRASLFKVPLQGNIKIKGPLDKINIDGNVNVSGGTIAFPIRTMKLLDGSNATINIHPDQPASINLNLIGQAKITALSSFNQRRQYNISMLARGAFDNLDANFTSSPPGLSKSDILALLTGQRQLEQLFASDTGNDFGSELSGLFTSALLPGVFDPITQSFGNALGLDELVIDLNYNEPVHISIGENIGNNFGLYYSTYLGTRPDYADSQYELKLTRKFRKNLELGISTDENHNTKFLVEGRMNF